MATWNAIVSASSDDARQAAGTVTLTDSPISLTAGTHFAGLRFAGCPIGNAEPINAATLTLELISGFANPDGLIVYGEDEDDAVTFTTASNNVSSRTPTTASVTWSGTSLGAGDRSPGDLAAIIAEITSRPGWVAGNALALILDALASTSFRFTSYDGSTVACARLVVDYTPAAAGQPMIARMRQVPGARRPHGQQGW